MNDTKVSTFGALMNNIDRIQGKYMLEKSEQDCERVYEFLRRIPTRQMYNIVRYRVP